MALFLLPVSFAWLTQQAAHWDFAVDRNTDQGTVFLHGERIDASCTEAQCLWNVSWDSRCIMVYPERIQRHVDMRKCMFLLDG